MGSPIDVDYKVLTTGLAIREKGDPASRQTGSLTAGNTVKVTQLGTDQYGGTWGKHASGWSVIRTGVSKATHMQPTQATSIPATNPTPAKTNDQSSIYNDTEFNYQEVNEIKRAISNEYRISSGANFQLKSARSILGLPHQFLHTADERIQGSSFGRLFTENILMDMPICTILPGGPKFLAGKGIKADDKKNLVNVMAAAASRPLEEIGSLVDEILGGKNARYYSFETQSADYMKIVNNLNRISSTYLGIRKTVFRQGVSDYENFDWVPKNMEVDGGKSIMELIGGHGAVTFYYDKSGSSMGESSSNSTDKSMLEGALNNASNMAKEAEFLFGVGAGQTFKAMNEQLAEQQINTLSENLAGSNGMMSTLWNNLKSGITTTFAGANMLLPEIWRDASFSRSYSLDVHLVSPYGSPEAYFLNIAVPMSYLLALALPRQFGANAYYSPFLVQAFASGVFNCNLGIVDSIAITRFGSGDAISRKGLPLEVRVSITFKDLYNSLAVSNNDNYGMLMNNTALLDFLANMSAVNLNEPDLERKLRIFLTSKADKILDIPGNIKNKFFDAIRDTVVNTLKY